MTEKDFDKWNKVIKETNAEKVLVGLKLEMFLI